MHNASTGNPECLVCGDADLMDQKAGFDSSTSVWQQTGWSEVDNLRSKLENLKELRDLVRQLGRAGGKGPLRMAPQEVSASIDNLVTICCLRLSRWHCKQSGWLLWKVEEETSAVPAKPLLSAPRAVVPEVGLPAAVSSLDLA